MWQDWYSNMILGPLVMDLHSKLSGISSLLSFFNVSSLHTRSTQTLPLLSQAKLAKDEKKECCSTSFVTHKISLRGSCFDVGHCSESERLTSFLIGYTGCLIMKWFFKTESDSHLVQGVSTRYVTLWSPRWPTKIDLQVLKKVAAHSGGLEIWVYQSKFKK